MADVLDPDRDKDVIEVAKQIKDYLSTRPHAADSLEGVVGWWLRRQQLEIARDRVQRALDYLVESGFVTATPVGPDECVYSVAGDHDDPAARGREGR